MDLILALLNDEVWATSCTSPVEAVLKDLHLPLETLSERTRCPQRPHQDHDTLHRTATVTHNTT